MRVWNNGPLVPPPLGYATAPARHVADVTIPRAGRPGPGRTGQVVGCGWTHEILRRARVITYDGDVCVRFVFYVLTRFFLEEYARPAGHVEEDGRPMTLRRPRASYFPRTIDAVSGGSVRSPSRRRSGSGSDSGSGSGSSSQRTTFRVARVPNGIHRDPNRRRRYTPVSNISHTYTTCGC